MLNRKVEASIENLKRSKPRNLIFQGETQKFLKQCAEELAASWLNTSVEELYVHPDFKYLDGADGVIGVENARVIQEMASYIPKGNCAVAILAHAETMTIDMQNRLLKVLEDCADTLAVIFIAAHPLLNTIHSRCLVVTMEKESMEDMYQYVEHPVPAIVLASDGNRETYEKIVSDAKFRQFLEGFYESYSKTASRDDLKYVLRYAHALRERDPEYPPDALENWQMDAFLAMLEHMSFFLLLSICKLPCPDWIELRQLPGLYKKEEAESIYRTVVDGREQRQKKGKFTKNDFFRILMELIPLDE